MKKKLIDALVEQINIELASAYKYFAMSTYFASRSLGGFSHWMELQAREEFNHAQKIKNFLLDRGHLPEFSVIEGASAQYSSSLEAFEQSLKQEQKLQDAFEKMMTLARDCGDATTQIFLEWFLTEQVEEIASCQTIIDRLKLAGNDGSALLLLDAELGKRQSGVANV